MLAAGPLSYFNLPCLKLGYTGIWRDKSACGWVCVWVLAQMCVFVSSRVREYLKEYVFWCESVFVHVRLWCVSVHVCLWCVSVHLSACVRVCDCECVSVDVRVDVCVDALRERASPCFRTSGTLVIFFFFPSLSCPDMALNLDFNFILEFRPERFNKTRLS